MNSLPPSPFNLPPSYERVRVVRTFAELATTPFADGVNALCWARTLPGDFDAVLAQLGGGEDVVTVDEDRLRALAVSAAGRVAVNSLIGDLQLLRERQLDPVLNCIQGYSRDDGGGPIATDVFSFHADSAPIPADTWLCTYAGAPSEGLRNEDARRRVDDPVTRAKLQTLFGGDDPVAFDEFLREHCYDLHYAPNPGARPYSFGRFNLWRIAIEYPGCPVPPCIHRAPATVTGQPRLLLIS